VSAPPIPVAHSISFTRPSPASHAAASSIMRLRVPAATSCGLSPCGGACPPPGGLSPMEVAVPVEGAGTVRRGLSPPPHAVCPRWRGLSPVEGSVPLWRGLAPCGGGCPPVEGAVPAGEGCVYLTLK
jgi:hypothetical protein